MLSSSGIACPDCFHGSLGDASRTPRTPIKPCAGGMGIRDGRGYGPYGKGYYDGPGGVPLPYGPNCERLGTEYDFTPGPGGGYLPHGPPRRILAAQANLRPLAGALGMSDGTRSLLAATGLALAAAGLGFAIWKSNRKAPKPRRRALLYRGRGQQRFVTLPR